MVCEPFVFIQEDPDSNLGWDIVIFDEVVHGFPQTLHLNAPRWLVSR
jgi:hypothetical protein